MERVTLRRFKSAQVNSDVLTNNNEQTKRTSLENRGEGATDMTVLSRKIHLLTVTTVAVLGLTGLAKAQTPPPPLPPYLGNFNAAKGWGFEPKLTSDLPGDVFVPMKEALEKNSQFPQVQRLFDLWSWQAFLAVNWPTSNAGQPAASIGPYAGSNPAWSRWHESNGIFLPNGATPPACTTQTAAAASFATERNLAGLSRAGVPAPPAAADLGASPALQPSSTNSNIVQ